MDATRERTNGNGASAATMAPPDLETNGTIAPETAPSDEAPARLRREARAELVKVERAAVGVVQAGRADVRGVIAGVIFGSKDISLERGGARDIVAGGAVRVSKGGAGTIIAGGDAAVSQSGAGMLLSLGHMQIEQGGGCGLVAANATVGRGGIVGVALTPRLEVRDGGRVLSTPAFVAGALAGIAGGLVLAGRIRRARG